MIFIELIEKMEQIKLKNKKNATLETSLDLKIYISYFVYLYAM